MSAPSAVRSVVLAGGGSAGHVSPLLAVADCLRRRDPDVRITAVGTQTGLETRLVPERGYDLRIIPRVVFPRRVSASAFSLPGALLGAVRAAATVLADVEADVVVGFGGYVSSPMYLAARRAGIPIVVHEANARPGIANRLGARLTPYVATTFAVTRLPHARLLGMPLRREVTTLDRAALRAEALSAFGLADHRPTLLVTGGSLGAQRLNETFSAAATALTAAGVQVLHVTGRGKTVEVPTTTPPYVVVEYVDRMDLAYAVADVVVTRAGANMVCELTTIGLPAVYVPLPIGNGEQRLNAADVIAAGGGVLVDDADATPEWVRRTLIPVLSDHIALERMARAARGAGHRDGDERVVDLITEAVEATVGARR